MEFRVLGPLEVIKDGRAATPRGRLQRGLLALLLLNANHVVTSNRLIDELWEDEPPDSARHALQVLVSALRKTLQLEGLQPTIVTRPTGYMAQVTEDELDLLRFERLVQEGRQALADGGVEAAAVILSDALSVWRGPALADLSSESFAQREGARLEEMRLAALEDRIEAELLRGRHTGIVPELQGLVRDFPLRERFRGQLVLALYRSHRQADALRVAREGRELLSEELGIDPAIELQQLELRVLQHDPTLDWMSPRDLAAPPPALTAAASPPAPASLPPGTEEHASTALIDKSGHVPRRRRTRGWLTAAIGLAVLAVVPVIVVIISGGVSKRSDSPRTIPQGLRIVPDSLVGLDPETLQVSDVIPIPGGIGTRVSGERQSGPIPVPQEYVLVGAGPLTPPAVGSCCGTPRAVALVGTVSHRVKLFQNTGQINGLAFGHGEIWIANCQANALTAFTGNNQFVGLATIRVKSLRNCAEVIGFDHGDFWVAELSPGESGYTHDIIDRLDPRTMAIKARIPVLSQTTDMAFGADSVWVVESGNDTHSFVYRISEESNRVAHRFQFPPRVPWPGESVAYGVGAAWVTDTNILYRINPADDSIRALTIPFPVHDLGSLAVGAGAVWTDESATGTLVKVDPDTGRVVGTKDFGFKVYGLRVYDGKIWVAVGDSLG
ncbi:MAG: AfsR/SARP family transcriptional regulator [Actinobacteria bacterium]|nr:MAG: AfsR/SARP family transcriptional regulator [Actinomycetota bacterium]